MVVPSEISISPFIHQFGWWSPLKPPSTCLPDFHWAALCRNDHKLGEGQLVVRRQPSDPFQVPDWCPRCSAEGRWFRHVSRSVADDRSGKNRTRTRIWRWVKTCPNSKLFLFICGGIAIHQHPSTSYIWVPRAPGIWPINHITHQSVRFEMALAQVEWAGIHSHIYPESSRTRAALKHETTSMHWAMRFLSW